MQHGHADAPTLVNFAGVMLALGQVDRARALAQHALALDPGHQEARVFLTLLRRARENRPPPAPPEAETQPPRGGP